MVVMNPTTFGVIRVIFAIIFSMLTSIAGAPIYNKYIAKFFQNADDKGVKWGPYLPGLVVGAGWGFYIPLLIYKVLS
ncbi:MAG: hypothetical protein ACLKAK_04735 [Alkaliphilus sp.]